MKKKNAYSAIALIAVILVINFVGYMINNFYPESSHSEIGLIPQSADIWLNSGIIIEDDSDFDLYHIGPAADGSISDPYIISDYIINASEGVGIRIAHTNAYYVVKNCVIMNATHGIHLENITVGEISSNTIYNCSGNGIFLEGVRATYHRGVNNINVMHNTIYNIEGTSDGMGNGIYLDWSCEYNYIFNNTIFNIHGTANKTGNGIALEGVTGVFGDCNYNTIIDNLIHDTSGTSGFGSGNGIYFGDDCSNNVITGNTIYGCYSASGSQSGSGISFSAWNRYNTISYNTIFGCETGDGFHSGNGINFYNDNDHTDILHNTIYNNIGDEGYYQGNGIIISGTSNLEFINNSVYGNMAGNGNSSGNGILLYGSTDNLIINNTFSDNNGGGGIESGNGIFIMLNSHRNHIEGNIIRNNTGENILSGNGVQLWNCDDVVFTDNDISYNKDHTTQELGISSQSGNGIILRGGNGINITRNSIDYNDNFGVIVGFSENCNITNNRLFGNYQTPCIYNYSTIASNILSPNDCTFLRLFFQEIENHWNGTIGMAWSSLPWADRYYVFRSLTEITPENYQTLSVHMVINIPSFIENLTEDGTYYYAIMAGNSTLNGTLTDSVEFIIVINDGPGNSIPFILLPGWILGLVTVAGISVRIYRKKT